MKVYRITTGDLLSLLTALLASAVSVASWYFFSPLDSIRKMDPLLDKIEIIQKNNRDALDKIEENQKYFALSVEKFNNIVNDSYNKIKDDDQKIAIAALRQEFEALNARMGKIEGAISISPENAIRSTLAINSISNMKEYFNSKNQDIYDNISRLYTIYFWSIGAVLVSIIVSPILRIVQGRSTSAGSKDQDQ